MESRETGIKVITDLGIKLLFYRKLTTGLMRFTILKMRTILIFFTKTRNKLSGRFFDVFCLFLDIKNIQFLGSGTFS